MTVPSSTYRNDYTGTAGTLVFPYTFRILADTEIVVTAQYETGDPVVLISYTVDGVGSQTGGNITFAVAPFDTATLDSLTFTRNPADTQNFDIRNQTSVPRAALEDALDRRTMVSLKQQEEIDRSLKFPITDTGSVLTLPSASQRANKTCIFDSIGGITAGATLASGDVVSAQMEPVVQAASLATARSAMGPWTDVRGYVNIADPAYNGSLAAAINALPDSGGVVFLPAGTYASPYTTSGTRLTKDNVTLIGVGKPWVNAGKTALAGGSIIQGPLVVGASNFSVTRLGIDSGSAVCTAMFGGTAQEGLILPWLSGDAERTNINIIDVSTLCKSSTSTVHACLVENYTSGRISGLSTMYAQSGLVIKSSGINVSDTLHTGHATYSVLAKSESTGNCAAKDLNFSNITIRSCATPLPDIFTAGQYDTAGFMVQASTADATRITVNGLVCVGATIPVFIQGLSSNKCEDISIQNVVARNSFSNVIQTSNLVNRVNICGVTSKLNNATAISIGSNTADVLMSNLYLESPNNYGFDVYGTLVQISNALVVSPAAGTGGLRQLAGDSTVSGLRTTTGTVVTITGGAVYGANGVLGQRNSPSNDVVIDSTGHILLGAGAAVLNNSVVSMKFDDPANGNSSSSNVATTAYHHQFFNPNGRVGLISTAGSSTTYATSSDYRLKTNIEPLTGALDKLRDLPALRFAWVSEPNGKKVCGFLAHQVAEVVAEAVVGNKDGVEMQVVDYSKLIPIIVAAVQELDIRTRL